MIAIKNLPICKRRQFIRKVGFKICGNGEYKESSFMQNKIAKLKIQIKLEILKKKN